MLDSMSLAPTALGVAAIVVVAFYFVFGSNNTESPVNAPPIPIGTSAKTTQKVCVVGAGTIGSSFVAVYLAQGLPKFDKTRQLQRPIV